MIESLRRGSCGGRHPQIELLLTTSPVWRLVFGHLQKMTITGYFSWLVKVLENQSSLGIDSDLLFACESLARGLDIELWQGEDEGAHHLSPQEGNFCVCGSITQNKVIPDDWYGPINWIITCFGGRRSLVKEICPDPEHMLGGASWTWMAPLAYINTHQLIPIDSVEG